MTEQAKFIAEHNLWAKRTGAARIIRRVSRKANKPRMGAFPVYKLTPEQQHDIRSNHHGSCEICGIRPESKRLSIDHCHDTGKVRGLLCSQCNSILGFAGDDSSRLMAAIAYLAKWTDQ